MAEKAAQGVRLVLNPRAFMIDRHEAEGFVFERGEPVEVPAEKVDALKGYKAPMFGDMVTVLVEARGD